MSSTNWGQRPRSRSLASLAGSLGLSLNARAANAQGLGASQGGTYQPSPRQSRLGPAPGDGANPLGGSPGAGEPVLEGRLGSPGPRFIPDPFPQALPEGAPRNSLGGGSIDTPARLPVSSASPYTSLALPGGGEDEEQRRTDLRNLGALLKLTPAESGQLKVRGALRDTAPPPVSVDSLLGLALANRPDLVAYCLGLGRAEADVQLALANRYADLFVLLQPYTFQDNSPLGRKSAHSWGMGVAVPLPLFNRNQGNIQRARLNVSQTQAELTALEDRVVFEVRQAERTHLFARAAVERIERSLPPRAVKEYDRVDRHYLAGQADELTFPTAESDFDGFVRQYRDTLVRHRRSMLKLNTTVGQRVLP